MLAASFPTLRSPAWTLQTDSGPAAEPASGVATFGFSGEASRPGLSTPAGALPPNPVRILLRFGRIRSFTARSASRFREIVGLAPRVLPLTPQVAFFHLIRTTPFSTPPVRFGSYCALAVIPGPFPGAFRWERSIRDNPYPFSPPGCDTGRLWRQFSGSSRTAG